MSADLFLERDAVISPCGRYRYLLRRAWDYNKPRALFIMLNPSTADAEVDDATIRSCRRLVTCLGYGSFEVVNLFSWRATDPGELATVPDPVGPDNGNTIDAAIRRCDIVICAWGAFPLGRLSAMHMSERIRAMRPTFCLGTTKNGAPRHPLYIKSGTHLEVYCS
jgi:hypothetical protein